MVSSVQNNISLTADHNGINRTSRFLSKLFFYPLWDLKDRSIKLKTLRKLNKTQWSDEEELKKRQWIKLKHILDYAYANCADPPGALSPTHPQMVDKYEGEYLLSSPVHTPWFSNLMAVMAISVFGYAVYTKKISIKTSS